MVDALTLTLSLAASAMAHVLSMPSAASPPVKGREQLLKHSVDLLLITVILLGHAPYVVKEYLPLLLHNPPYPSYRRVLPSQPYQVYLRWQR
jgi:hypothetical protein